MERCLGDRVGTAVIGTTKPGKRSSRAQGISTLGQWREIVGIRRTE